MAAMAGFIWWLLAGVLLGWTLSWLLARWLRGNDRSAELQQRIDELTLRLDTTVESKDAAIALLTSDLATLRARPPAEAPAEPPAERIVEVEKVVVTPIDNPQHLARIRQLEGWLADADKLRSLLRGLEAPPEQRAAPATTLAPAKPADHAIEKLFDPGVLHARIRELESGTDAVAALREQLAAREAEIAALKRGPAIDLDAAKAAGFDLAHADDLEALEGIGPRIAELLRDAGITTFGRLAQTTPAEIQRILVAGGPNFRFANPQTWPEQADLAARNHWRALKALQNALAAGQRPPAQ